MEYYFWIAAIKRNGGSDNDTLMRLALCEDKQFWKKLEKGNCSGQRLHLNL